MSKAIERTNARELLIKLIFQWDYSQEHRNIEIDDITDEKSLSYDKKYFISVKNNIFDKLEEIDKVIGSYSKRPIQELTKVELAVLRLASYELMYVDEIPFKVSIDQATRLNKKFGTTEGYRYINAILDAVAKNYRELEYLAAKESSK